MLRDADVRPTDELKLMDEHDVFAGAARRRSLQQRMVQLEQELAAAASPAKDPLARTATGGVAYV